MRIETRAYAKINIGLRVLDRRSDGYHSVWTVLQMIDLYDILEMEKLNQSRIEFDSEGIVVPQGEGNICFKAARLILNEAHISGGLRIRLKKRIPVGSGLGGGSSDAASVLKGINEIFNLGLPVKHLEKLAGRLGSDVPFFIHGGTKLATGRGEILRDFKVEGDFRVLLVVPEEGISSHWAYSRIDLNLTYTEKNIKLSASIFRPGTADNNIFINDFEPVIFRSYPHLGEIKERLLEYGADYASMTGSGSAIFGLFSDYSKAERAEPLFNGRYRTYLTEFC
ncbi:MAG: 4-(cytidine 5'-diphospho)-2-C-methyl-D-erythritol kinase [Fidelibacterota bacterium]